MGWELRQCSISYHPNAQRTGEDCLSIRSPLPICRLRLKRLWRRIEHSHSHQSWASLAPSTRAHPSVLLGSYRSPIHHHAQSLIHPREWRLDCPRRAKSYHPTSSQLAIPSHPNGPLLPRHKPVPQVCLRPRYRLVRQQTHCTSQSLRCLCRQARQP